MAEASNEFLCRGCKEPFRSAQLRSNHHKNCELALKVVKAYSKTDGKFKCALCPLVTSKQSNMSRHHKKQHLTVKPQKVKKVFACQTCKKTFATRYKLTRHEDTHNFDGYECGLCKKKYRRIDMLNKHVKKCVPAPVAEEENAETEEVSMMDHFVHGLLEVLPTGSETDNVALLDSVPENEVLVIDEVENIEGDARVPNYDFVEPENETEQYPSNEDMFTSIVIFPYSQSSFTTSGDIVSDGVVPTLMHNASCGDEEIEACLNSSCSEWEYRKKRENLASVLENITVLSKQEQRRIINHSFNASSIDIGEALLMTNADKIHEGKLVAGLLDYLKRHPLKTSQMKSQFSTLIHGICGDNLEDDEFLEYLCRKVGKRKSTMDSILNNNNKEQRGRKPFSTEQQQIVYDTWHEFSVVTVDRRNNRDTVKVKRSEYIKHQHLKTPSHIIVEPYTSKRKQQKVKSTRYISTKTVREIKHVIESRHAMKVSLGYVHSFRPFYIVPPTEREKESCLCKFCLNLRLKFLELQKHLKDNSKKQSSMSTYFANGITCEPDQNGFYQLKCTSSKCSECKLSPMFSDDHFNIPDKVNFFQFEVEEYTYKNKAGVEKVRKRTTRFPKTESFTDFKRNFDVKGTLYLQHRFECKNDVYVWPQILNDSSEHIFHVDYSENVSVTPKFEPQDAHFSGKQTSLHCAVVHSPHNADVKYVYHLSDDKRHDFAFTEVVVRDLLTRFEIDSIVRIKSDNCTYQYCCLYVFQSYMQLSRELKKTIILYYGVNGHGRGLVDAMSGFGVKTPLRHDIITNDFMFNTAEELFRFLIDRFESDKSKIYVHLPEEKLDGIRTNKGTGFPIPGCQKSRMISFFPTGYFQIKRHLCNCDNCFIGEFNKCLTDNIVEVGDLPEEIEELDEADTNDMHLFVEAGSFAAVYSTGKSFEIFYVVKITEKDVANDDISDVYGHLIQKGEAFFKGHYLEKVKESKSKVHYKLHKKVVYIYPGEIFCPAIEISEDLTISIEDYLFLIDTLSR